MEDSHYSVVAAAEPSVEAEFVFDDGNGGGDEDDGVHVAGSAAVVAADDETNGTENSNVVVVVAVVAWSGEVDVENFDDDGERYDDTAEVVVAAAVEMNYGYSHD